MAQVVIDSEILEELLDPAARWSEELVNYIAPASHDFGDEESAESQEGQAESIERAITTAAALIDAATRED